ncbi:MAG: preprotein translocase subunit YajC [Puniceicoccales bacterium]|jgi:preprotein translocase subunit YajC|nr:preprotein translocase subunit YajC [Puniceicoccales bacterium]
MYNKILFAEQVAAQQGFGLQSLLVFALLFVGMWFLMIAPQRKKQKEHVKMIQALKAGDEVVTSSGIFGTIANVKNDRFVLKIGDDTKIEIFKSYIQAKVGKK